jgi:hypothetical protein
MGWFGKWFGRWFGKWFGAESALPPQTPLGAVRATVKVLRWRGEVKVLRWRGEVKRLGN